MMRVELAIRAGAQRVGLKGPGAAAWLAQQGIPVPERTNAWIAGAVAEPDADDFIVARLGASEFFLEEGASGRTLSGLAQALCSPPPGVYPVLREDCGFVLAGDAAHDVLAQVCNVDFASLDVGSQPVIMTLMIGVSVLVVPQTTAGARRRYRIWCDPTFGGYLGETLTALVIENGGTQSGVAA